MRRLIAGALVGVLAVVGYAAVAPDLGLEWPYPQRLPHSFKRGRWTFNRTTACRSRVWWYRTQKIPSRFVGVGRLDSAVGFDGAAVYAWDFERPGPLDDYNTLFVQADSGCFIAYGNYDAGG